jgi:hypothetical protein
MNKVYTTSLFCQLLSLFKRTDFSRHVRELNADYKAKGFSCWDQFVAMLFCQLGRCRSLREITQGLRSCEGRLQHLGLKTAPKRSTLSYANAHRPWQLYERVFHDLLKICRPLAPGKPFRFKNKLLSLDATVIDLCAEVFDWAKFRQAKGAIKLHLLLDHDGYLPTFACIREGREHELKAAQQLSLPTGSIVVMDRGYVDYRLFERWTAEGVFFVTRMKKNADWCGTKSRPTAATHIRRDEEGAFNVLHAGRKILGKYRRIDVWIEEKKEVMTLLTNNFALAAATIARIYKSRWQIELFFRAIKQNLRVKTFVGTSANAVHIQIWTALIALLLLKYLQFKSRLNWHLSNLLAILRLNLFRALDLARWIENPFEATDAPEPPAQGVLPGMDIGQQNYNRATAGV